MVIKEYIKLQKIFVESLNEKTLSYLKSRALNEQTIKHFGLGYCDGVDVFNCTKIKNSISIPYYDMYGRVVAFQFRSLDPDADPKYKYTYNFEHIYVKSRFFYNLSHVIKKFYNRAVYVLEGQFDTMSMHQAGMPNAIAIGGSKMTEIQHEILYRYFDKVFFVLDADDEGDLMVEFMTSTKDRMKKYRNKYGNMILYKIKVDKENCKDVNDLLKTGVDVKQYLKSKKERMI